jgi:hypothetical protein
VFCIGTRYAVLLHTSLLSLLIGSSKRLVSSNNHCTNRIASLF